MKNYFGKEIASQYDSDLSIMDPNVVDPIVHFLQGLVKNGSALEFGIRTGRIALPLIFHQI